jgi:hypothetical protein
LESEMYQGLGTGGLYTNNFPSPLFVKDGTLNFDQRKKWDLGLLNI